MYMYILKKIKISKVDYYKNNIFMNIKKFKY